ncbi:methyl-accepting chemotaxis protein [Psychrobacillus sp. BL-248-WT-3]|uniref:methyl-accepting chemotaxis protein n=1 Tax=Psychrobacillus sp. BL-248-WT-3 TaxID=2725306 RepID=UPI00146F078B|nr:methyl-accepting chemotaxis protein [Psychrobacillus sp. BL-248-WT-3]NME06069.1 HAMP domain-containing protein [Psychrobacillus sp. BL-248-WT-3]
MIRSFKMSIKTKISTIITIVVATNILLGLMGLFNLQNVQSSLEESLESRSKNLNLLRTVGIDFHQMYIAEKNLYLYEPSTSAFKDQLEEYNGQKVDIEERFSEYYSNIINLPNEKKLAQAHEDMKEEYFTISNEVVQLLSSSNPSDREQGMLLSQNEGYIKFDAAEESLDVIGDLYFDNNEIMLKEVKEKYSLLFTVTCIVILLCLIVSSLLGLLVIRSINRPIQTLRNSVKKVAEGDLTVNIKSFANDELGELSKDFNLMTEQTKQLISTVRNTVEHLSDSSHQLSLISDETSVTGEKISKEIVEIAEGVTKQKVLTEATDQKTLELSNVINKLNEKNIQMDELSANAKVVLQRGVGKLKDLQEKTEISINSTDEVVKVVHVLAENMKKIGYIVQTLNEISSQTNLLALNASIEAARAGEYGVGFAVVAAEVQKLAAQSATASKQIEDTIMTIENDTVKTLDLMNQTAHINSEQGIIMGETGKAFNTLNDAISHILHSLTEINGEILNANLIKEDVVKAISEISDVANEVSLKTELINASVDHQYEAFINLQESAEMLNGLSEKVNEMIQSFHIED